MNYMIDGDNGDDCASPLHDTANCKHCSAPPDTTLQCVFCGETFQEGETVNTLIGWICCKGCIRTIPTIEKVEEVRA